MSNRMKKELKNNQAEYEKNLEMIKAKQEELQKELYAVSEKVYKAANPQGDPNAQAGGAQPGSDPNVYEADYTDVDDSIKQ